MELIPPETTPVTDIIMAAHNAARTIDSAIQSVLDQEDPSWRLWVIDDGSTDATALHVTRYTHDPRIHLISQPGQGAAAARNRGLDSPPALGDYVAFLDSDDIWHPEFLVQMKRALQSDSAAGLAWCEMECFEGATGRYRGDRPPIEGSAAETLPRIFSDVTFLGSGVLCRGEFFRDGLRYPERYRTMEDVHVWSAIAAQSKILHVRETWVDYRIGATSLSNAAGSWLRNLADNVESYRELYRRYPTWIPRELYRERMWRAHHFAAEDRMRSGHTGGLCSLRALFYRPGRAATWKNLALGVRAKLREGVEERSANPRSSDRVTSGD